MTFPRLRPLRSGLWALLLPLLAHGAQDRKEPAEVSQARAALEKNPDDPKANTTLGLYLAKVQEDWPAALPHLAKSKDPEILPAAGKERENGTTPQDLIAIGDLWAAAARKHAPHRDAFRLHANDFYGKAWTGRIDDSLRRDLRAKLKALLTTGPSSPRASRACPKGWTVNMEGGQTGSDREYVRGSKQSLKMLAPPQGLVYSFVKSEVLPVKGGETFKASMWVLSEGGTGFAGDLSIDFFPDKPPPTYMANPRNFIADRPFWSRIEVEATPPAWATKVALRILFGAHEGTVFIDDCSLQMNGRELLSNPGFE